MFEVRRINRAKLGNIIKFWTFLNTYTEQERQEFINVYSLKEVTSELIEDMVFEIDMATRGINRIADSKKHRHNFIASLLVSECTESHITL